MKNLISAFLLKYGIKFSEEKGGREFLFRCPFHNDSRPSMWMNTTSGKFHCFACLSGGHSLEHFIKKLTGQVIKISDYLTAGDLFTSKIKQIYEDSANKILSFQSTVDFMQTCELEFANFVNVKSNEIAYEYLKKKRKFTDKTIEQFKLKYAISGNYESRIIIPYFKGNSIVGFNSRLVGASKDFLKEIRYLYLVNNIEFHDFLYGWDNIKNNEFVILVEGPFDLMYMVQCGFKNVVSPLTTRLTPSQYLKIADSKKIIFCYDNDENNKGYEGAMKAAEMILKMEPDKHVFIMKLPNYKDPNECSPEELIECSKRLKRISIKQRNNPIFDIGNNVV